MNEIDIELGSLGKLKAAVTPKSVQDIEAQCGGVLGVARRFATLEVSYLDCVVVVQASVKAGMGDLTPSVEEIQQAVLDAGLKAASDAIRPILERIMGGAE